MSEPTHEFAVGDLCPNPECGHRIVEADDTEYLWCEWCGWDNYPRCAHGHIEWEFCVQCPDGGV